jgi:hypothetical protein
LTSWHACWRHAWWSKIPCNHHLASNIRISIIIQKWSNIWYGMSWGRLIRATVFSGFVSRLFEWGAASSVSKCGISWMKWMTRPLQLHQIVTKSDPRLWGSSLTLVQPNILPKVEIVSWMLCTWTERMGDAYAQLAKQMATLSAQIGYS